MDSIPFSELAISQEILRALTDMGFEEATPIQAQTIPYILEHRDVLGQAQTGTGKTCAFGIPVIDSVDKDEDYVQTLILSPTRELAIQIAEELHNVAKYTAGIRMVAVYGGQPIDRQIMALKRRPQIVVGTPGRVMDHMRRKTLRLDHLDRIVLDEADEMLNMGFKEDIDTILESVPHERQTVLFSATMPPAIKELTNRYQDNPIQIKIAAKELTIPLVEQFYIELREANKTEVLTRLLDAENVTRALVFCNTKRKVDDLTERLSTRGYSVEALHGDMKQSARDRVMKAFRQGTVDILVATDVAARGIDVDDIEMVFNYDLPSDEEYYVHRIGRTGRAGKTGKAFTFVVGREIMDLKNIQRLTKATLQRATVPSVHEVRDSKIAGVLEKTADILNDNHLDAYVQYIETFLERTNVSGGTDDFHTTADIAAALLKQLANETIVEHQEIEEVIPYEEYTNSRREAKAKTPSTKTRNHGKKEEPGMKRLFFNVGIENKIRPNQIVQFVASRSNIPGSSIGAIAIFDEYTFVDVPEDVADHVVSSTNNEKIGRQVVRVEFSGEKRAKPSKKTEKGETDDSRMMNDSDLEGIEDTPKKSKPKKAYDKKPAKDYSDKSEKKERKYATKSTTGKGEKKYGSKSSSGKGEKRYGTKSSGTKGEKKYTSKSSSATRSGGKPPRTPRKTKA